MPVTSSGGLRHEVASQMERLHERATQLVRELDPTGRLKEDRWDRAGGGGGVSRMLSDGATFEKAGINRSTVQGALSLELARRIGAHWAGQGEASFFASGVSLVLHPRSPMVPTVHLNVRYFEIWGSAGEQIDAWFGGGTDLTPTYPYPDDAVHFHRALRAACDRHHASFYARFKIWCDHYFVNTHRGDERRGVGGIFFDHLRAGEAGLCLEQLLAFVTEIGDVLPQAYRPIVDRRRDTPYGERERRVYAGGPGGAVGGYLGGGTGEGVGLSNRGRGGGGW